MGLGALLWRVPGLRVGRRAPLALPYFADFSADTLAQWLNTSYSLSGGKAVNTPEFGADLMDAGAGEFASGVGHWTTGGGNTLEAVDGELHAAYVDNGTGAQQQLTGANDLQANLTAGLYLTLKWKGRVSSGATIQMLMVTQNNYYFNIAQTVQTDFFVPLLYAATTPTVIFQNFGAGEEYWMDDFQVLPRTAATLFAVPDLEAATNPHVWAQYSSIAAVQTAPGLEEWGIVSKLDSQTNPQNYVIAIVNRNANNQICLYKVVNGTPTRLGNSSVSMSIDETFLELRWSGNDVSLWHDGVQMGTTQTVSDAGIASNTLHGIYGTGATKLIAFGLAEDQTDLYVGYIGGSITWQSANTSPGYRHKTFGWIKNHVMAYDARQLMIANNGQIAWEELARLRQGQWTDVPSEIIIDLAANHLSNTDFEDSTIEALIRYLRATYPSARLLLPIFGVWSSITDTTTTSSSTTRRAALVALAQHYDLDYVDIGAAMEAAIAGGATLSDWYTTGDLTHPNAAGHAYAAGLLEAYLTEAYLTGGAAQWTGDLADYDRVNANSDDYDDVFQLTDGVDNSGETGAGWATDLTTARTSSTADDTIAFMGTFRSFGLYHTQTGQIQYSVDGGAYSATINLASQRATFLILSGLDYTPHTVTFKVVSGAPVFRQFIAESVPIYGVSWDGSSSPTLTRTDDAVGMTAEAGVDAGVVTNDFDTADIFREITEVTDAFGNVFVRIPAFYIRKTATGAARTWQISKVSHGADWYLPWCFWDFTNSIALPYVDVGKYPASLSGASKLESKAGVYPLVNKNIVEMRGYAQANGAGYQLLDVHVVDLLQTLFYIEFATLNSQAIMAGYTAGQYNAAHTATANGTGVNQIEVANAVAALYAVGQAIGVGTSVGGNQVFYGRTITAINVVDASNKALVFDGDPVNIAIGNIVYNIGYKHADGITATSGSIASNSSGLHYCKYRGIISLWGNVWQFVDGLNINEYQAWVCLDADDYASNLFASPFASLGYVNANANGYVSALGWDANYPFAALPTAAAGLAATYYGDYYYQGAGPRVAAFGGFWYDLSRAGLSCWPLHYSSAIPNVAVGSRLVRKAG